MTVTQFDVTTDTEFKSLIPPMSDEEFAGLEESILRDGCLDPLIVWKDKGILIDGHNRKSICDKYGIDYQVHEMSFDSREMAADWIDAHHLARRNLTPNQMSLIRGRRYNRSKRQDGGHGDQKSGGQNVPPNTAEKLAAETGVTSRTIKRDGQYADAVSKLDIEREIAHKQIDAPRVAIIETARQIVIRGDNE